MMTVSIVSPNAPMKVNATIRCASVGFGRKSAPAFAALPPSMAVGRCGASGGGGCVSVGGVVTVGRVVRLPFSRDHARQDHTLNALHGTLEWRRTNGKRPGLNRRSGKRSMARIAAAIALAAVAFSGNAAARPLQEVLNTGTLRVGVTLFAPWAARGADGDLHGFEIDVARQLAADMGVKAQISSYDVDRLVPALEAGDIDVIAAGLTITPERALHVNFSNPYAESGVGLATHVERTASVTDIKALDSDGITIAAVEGSVGVQLARRLWPRAKVQVFQSVEAASRALVAGEVHGYVDDEPVPTFLALEN